MRRRTNVVASNRVDLGVLVTHTYKLDDIVAAYELFANQCDGVLKGAVSAELNSSALTALDCAPPASRYGPG